MPTLPGDNHDIDIDMLSVRRILPLLNNANTEDDQSKLQNHKIHVSVQPTFKRSAQHAASASTVRAPVYPED